MVELWLLGRPEQTVKSYRRDAEHFLAFVAPKALPDVTVKDVGDWAQSIEGATNYRIRRLMSVKSLLSFAKRTGYCVANVGEVLRVPRPKRRTPERVTNVQVVRDMTAEAKAGRDQTLIRFMYAVGCRVSEAVGINFGDVSIKATPDGPIGMVTLFGKGQKTRHVPFKAEVAREILALRRPGDSKDSPVFRNFVNGKRLSVRSVQRMVKAARVGGHSVVVTPHVFRHTHAMVALERGAPVERLQHQLGHSNISTTNYYVHLQPGAGTGQDIIL